MFTYDAVIRLGHTDAAGLIYYARLFDLAHAAYEAFLDHIEHPLSDDMSDGHGVTIPIVHATADYRAPLRLNDRVRIEVRVTAIGERSYEVGYRFLKTDGVVAAEARTAHVAVNKSAGEAVELPAGLAGKLQPHLD